MTLVEDEHKIWQIWPSLISCECENYWYFITRQNNNQSSSIVFVFIWYVEKYNYCPYITKWKFVLEFFMNKLIPNIVTVSNKNDYWFWPLIIQIYSWNWKEASANGKYKPSFGFRNAGSAGPCRFSFL